MEKRDEPKKVEEKKKLEDKTIPKEASSDKSKDIITKNIKSKPNNQYSNLELNKEHFQIIQQKPQNKEITENKLNSKDIIKEHKALSDKDIVNSINNMENKNSSSQINEIKEIKETYKKSRSLDFSQTNYKYYNKNKDNNENVYSLLNSYYKDIDLNFKDKKEKSSGKNFMLKNQFQESNSYIHNNNNDNTNDNYGYHANSTNQYNYPFMPYFFYPNLYYMNNNQNNFSYNNDNQIPENVFSINNHINYHLSNNINYYNYNFHRNKFKQNNRYTNNNDNNNNNEHKLYIIDTENIVKGIEKRTTVMIRHIPNRYTYQTLQDEINVVCKDKYDFLYLPLDSENNCNLGYAFINFINPLHIVRFYEMFKSRKWLRFNSYKECDLSFAKFQGKTALTSNYEKNINTNIDKRKIPLIFEIKYPPKIDLPKKYFEMVKEYKANFLKDINWI